MSNKKLTAVEWLNEQLQNNVHHTIRIPSDIIQQAKEMEKQMTIKLYVDYENYLEEAFKNQCGGQAKVLSFEEFYEQIYGGNK
jgi:HEPN domain-containing protein